jgi:hypothetical protein
MALSASDVPHIGQYSYRQPSVIALIKRQLIIRTTILGCLFPQLTGFKCRICFQIVSLFKVHILKQFVKSRRWSDKHPVSLLLIQSRSRPFPASPPTCCFILQASQNRQLRRFSSPIPRLFDGSLWMTSPLLGKGAREGGICLAFDFLQVVERPVLVIISSLGPSPFRDLVRHAGWSVIRKIAATIRSHAGALERLERRPGTNSSIRRSRFQTVSSGFTGFQRLSKVRRPAWAAPPPIDAPAQHSGSFRHDSEPAKLGHCRISKRNLGGVSVA